MSELNWIAVSEQLPPDGQTVMTKIDTDGDCRNEQALCRRGNLYFTGDGLDAMYVYYAPTHWTEFHQEQPQ